MPNPGSAAARGGQDAAKRGAGKSMNSPRPAGPERTGGQSRMRRLGRRVVSLLWRDDLDTAFAISIFMTASAARAAISSDLQMPGFARQYDRSEAPTASTGGACLLDQPSLQAAAPAGPAPRRPLRARPPAARTVRFTDISRQTCRHALCSQVVVLNLPLADASFSSCRSQGASPLRPSSNLGDRFGPVSFARVVRSRSAPSLPCSRS